MAFWEGCGALAASASACMVLENYVRVISGVLVWRRLFITHPVFRIRATVITQANLATLAKLYHGNSTG